MNSRAFQDLLVLLCQKINLFKKNNFPAGVARSSDNLNSDHEISLSYVNNCF